MNRLVICDPDRDYGSRLAGYLRRSECGYEVLLYWDPAGFVNDMAGVAVSLLLIQEDFLDAVRQMSDGNIAGDVITADRRYILVESREKLKVSSEAIYKYQSAAGIIAAIGDDIEASHRIVNEAQRDMGVEFIGIYSPVNHSLKTTFAMTLGKIMSEERQVLYINMEGYNGLSDLLDIRSELSLQDLIYEYSLNPEGLSAFLPKYMIRADGLNILIPLRSPFELQEIEPALWLSFLGDIAAAGRFGSIILDISDAARGFMEIMRVCSVIYMPLRKDNISRAKLKDFEYSLSKYPGGEDIRSKIKRLRFPYFEDIDGSFFSSVHGKLGRYIRREICGGSGYTEISLNSSVTGNGMQGHSGYTMAGYAGAG